MYLFHFHQKNQASNPFPLVLTWTLCVNCESKHLKKNNVSTDAVALFEFCASLTFRTQRSLCIFPAPADEQNYSKGLDYFSECQKTHCSIHTGSRKALFSETEKKTTLLCRRTNERKDNNKKKDTSLDSNSDEKMTVIIEQLSFIKYSV